MNKPFLLMAGCKYEIHINTDSWINCYETHEEAQEQIKEGTYAKYLIGEEQYDWYDIVDLREWASDKE